LFHSDVPDSILATVSFRHFGVAFDKNSFHWCSRLAEPGEYTAEATSLVLYDPLWEPGQAASCNGIYPSALAARLG